MKYLPRIALLSLALIGSTGCRTSIGSYSLFGGSSDCGCGSTVVSAPVSGKITEIEPPLAPTAVTTPSAPKTK